MPTTTTTATTTELPAEIAPPPNATGAILVEGSDGSVLLVDPALGTRETIHVGDGDGSVVQATGSDTGNAVVWSMSSGDDNVGLWLDGESSEFEAPFVPFFFAFSPDESQIAMLGNEESEVGLAVLDLEAGVIESVDRGAPYYLDWHGESSLLGVHIGGEFAGTVDLDGRRAAIEGSAGAYLAPDWLDHRRLLTVVRPGDVVARAGPELVVLGTDSGGTLAAVDVESGRTERLRDVIGPVAFQATPDGGAVAYVEAETRDAASPVGPLSVLVLDGEGGPVVVSQGPVVAFEWSPSGDQLLFLLADVESGLLAPHVWDGSEEKGFEGYVPTPVFFRQYLPFWDQFSRSLTTWSPAGDAFVYAALGEDGGEVWVQLLDGGRRKVADGEFASWIGTGQGGGAVVP